MNQITIRKATLDDLISVQQIGRETFFETFEKDNTEANMEKYLAENFSQEKLTAELTNCDSQFFVAWDNKTAVGYLKINSGSARTEQQDVDSLEIERIYVKNAYQGKRVGQMLYEKSLEVARLQNNTCIWLGVWEENRKAIRFYEKNGFVAFDKHIFRFGEDEQIDIMMKKILK
jgi:ribosomal protein S18 acetylase RimI-like enzyme